MHFSSRRRSALAPVAAIVLALAAPLGCPIAAWAQDDGTADAVVSGAVARIDAVAGDVAIQRGDSNDAVAAVQNAPVLGADYVTTGPNGRAEVGFDGRSAVRLGENVQIRFGKIDPDERQMQLAAGTIDLRLFGDTDGQSTVDTPSISVVPRTSGSFRVSVDADGVTAVTIRSGRADIVTPQGAQPLEPGTTLIAAGPAARPDIQTQPAIAFDSFDRYNGERDRIYEVASAQGQYVNTEIQGVGDLSAAGNWVDDGTYGHVWIPTAVASDWAPYRDGNWTWEDGYGWTWVAAEPWGWAPYHYGRWYYSNAYHHWAWFPPAPGRYAPAWSPALVGFVGFSIGAVSVGLGFGHIGWVPLAPYEAIHPWWGRGASTVVVNSTMHYRNLAVNNALTAVSRENFQSGRFAARTMISQEQLRSMRPVQVQGALPIVPGRANLRFTQRAVAPSLAARPSFVDRSFAGRGVIPQRTPFTQQQASVSRATHVAYRPEAAPAAGAPGYARPTELYARPARPAQANPAPMERGPNESWSRFNTNRNVDRTNGAGYATPAYARPAGPSGAYDRPSATYARPAPPAATYARPEAPGATYARPSAGAAPYARPAAPPATYARPAAPADTRLGSPAYTRPAAPAYTRPAAPAYTRPAAPAYTRPASPAYARGAAPAYNRPAGPGYARPAAPEARPAPAAAHAAPPAHETRGSDDRRDR